MAIYLGSTEVADLYLGESGYGLANVVKVYLGTDEVWPENYTVTFSTGYDGVCTSAASLISVAYGNTTYFGISVSFSSTGPGNVSWQGSSDNGLSWQSITGFGGYHSGASSSYLNMNSYSGTGYRIRAVVDGVATTTSSATGNYIDFPPCEPPP